MRTPVGIKLSDQSGDGRLKKKKKFHFQNTNKSKLKALSWNDCTVVEFPAEQKQTEPPGKTKPCS